jgi:hypothetical protein
MCDRRPGVTVHEGQRVRRCRPEELNRFDAFAGASGPRKDFGRPSFSKAG